MICETGDRNSQIALAPFAFRSFVLFLDCMTAWARHEFILMHMFIIVCGRKKTPEMIWGGLA